MLEFDARDAISGFGVMPLRGIQEIRMNRIWTGIALAAVLSMPAMAADIGKPPVYLKAPGVHSGYNWSGFYVGAHVGHDWGRSRVISNGVLTEAAVPMDGVIGGLLVGMNWQTGAFVYGLEADIGIANLRGTGVILPTQPTIVQPPNHYKADLNANIRGRIGYAIQPTTLIFTAGGLALANFEFYESWALNAVSNVLTGWTIGGGIDQSFSSNLIGRLEYLYADYGNMNFSAAPGDIYNIGFKSQTLRGALIWKL